MWASGEADIISIGEVVSFNEQVAPEVIFYFLYFFILGQIAFFDWFFLFKGQEEDSFNLVYDGSLYFACFFADLDQEQKIFVEDGDDSQEAWTHYFLLRVGR